MESPFRVRSLDRGVALGVLAFGLVAFAAFQMFVSVHRYLAMQASTMDLGAFAQVLWKISHGHWRGFSTVFQDPALGEDGSFWLYPLAFGFRWLGGVYFLFAVQVICTGLAAVGIYRAAETLKLPLMTGVLAALGFLLLPGVIGGSQFDFHPDFLALVFVVWMYVAYLEGRRTWYYTWFLAAALAKFMVLVSLVGWGVGLLLWRRRVVDGVVAVLLAAGLLLAELGWFLPTYFAGATLHANLGDYAYLGHGVLGIAVGLWRHIPELVRHVFSQRDYILWVFGPFLGLSLAGSAATPAALALFVLNAASTFSPQQNFNTQYQVMLSGWLALAAIEALARWPRWSSHLAVIMLAGTVAFETAFLGYVVVPQMRLPVAPLAEVRGVFAAISRQDVVWTQSRLGVFAYRFSLLGVDREMAPGVMLDSLQTLWRETGRADPPTAIVARTPFSPYLADVAAAALTAGYHVTRHIGHLLVIEGTRRFGAPSPAPYFDGWEPAMGTVWTLPAATQATRVGRPLWSSMALMSLAGHPGALVQAFKIVLPAGRYRLWVTWRAAQHGLGPRRLGYLWCRGLGETHVVPLTASGTYGAVTVRVTRLATLTIGVITLGRVSYVLRAIGLTRIGARATP
jgi:uncharacterized membrane protein